MTNEERNFRWAYQLLVNMAKQEFNIDKLYGKISVTLHWDDLRNRMKGEYLEKALKTGGIDPDTFFNAERESGFDVKDILELETNKEPKV